MSLKIPIFTFIIKPLLWLSRFFDDNYFVLVCKGYNDDWENFTGIDWQEDKENCLDYEDYQLWLNFSFGKSRQ